MNIKIVKSERSSNTGSVGKLVRYLEKENKGKALGEKTYFFSHDRDKVSRFEVVRHLDGNVKNLGRKDGKFFLINISPSQSELKHIGNDPRQLMAYTRQVMEAYAENFNKGLQGKDLLYYAKIEQFRYYHGNDPDVKAGRAKQGDIKPGLHTHVHVIVSRKDRENRLKLSPLSKHRRTQKGPVRGGFDREAFVAAAEKIWDREMQYDRHPEDSFAFRHARKKELKLERVGERLKLKAQQMQPGGGTAARAFKRGAGYDREWDVDLVEKRRGKDLEM